MKQTTGNQTRTRAVMQRPALAVLAQTDGPAQAAPTAHPLPREVRIREAAYARYEARGCAHGQDVDDWLAAEAALDSAPTAASTGAAASSH